MNFTARSIEKEWMDLGDAFYTLAEYDDCLVQLERIGRFMGGDRTSYKGFSYLSHPPTSILDVGCGGGAFTLKLAKRYPNVIVEGADVSEAAILSARTLQKKYPELQNISFTVMPEPTLKQASKSIDVVTATLLCHHLSDEEMISFLQSCCSIARKAVILNDLHRHPMAHRSFACIAPLFFPNRMIVHDGLLSIKRAFTRSDWEFYLDQAGIPREKCKIKWCFPFRWLLYIDCRKEFH